MKFQPDTATGLNAISRQEPGRVWVGPAVFHDSVIVPWEGSVLPWAVPDFEVEPQSRVTLTGTLRIPANAVTADGWIVVRGDCGSRGRPVLAFPVLAR